MADKIFIRDLRVNCVIGCGPDERVKTQPLVVNVTLHVDVSDCGDSDHLHHTVNYSSVAKRLAALIERSRCYTLEALATAIAADCLTSPDCSIVEAVTVRLDKPEAFSKLPAVPCVEIHRKRAYFSTRRPRRSSSVWREDEATVAAALPAGATSAPAGAGPVAAATTTAYLAIGTNLGDRVGNIRAALRLLQAVPAGGGWGGGLPLPPAPFVRLTATSFLYETPPAYVLDQPPFLNGALAVETNLSPLVLLRHIKANVEGALGRDAAGLRFGPRVIDVDILLYGPNAVVEAGAELTVPHARLPERDFVLVPLCDLCPGLMHPTLHLSMTDLLRNLRHGSGLGSSSVDSTGRSPRAVLTRVLPLPSLVPVPVPAGGGEANPECGGSSSSSGSNSSDSGGAGSGSRAGGRTTERLLRLGSRTFLVGVLNVTPDSFSDGGAFFSPALVAAPVQSSVAGPGAPSASAGTGAGVAGGCGPEGVAAAVAHAVAMAADGADVVDVGGQSTRPGSDRVPPEVEAARVVPVIAALRAALPALPLSVDTFYASVAEAAVAAGADIVNDVSGGLLDPGMLPAVARMQVPVVLMHMRGTPQNMASLAHYGKGGPGHGSEAEDGSDVVPAVRAALALRASAALAAGVPRWNVLLDPGLGFAKQAAHNYALLRPSGRLDGPVPIDATGSESPSHGTGGGTAASAGFGLAGYPLLYGPSRKKFLGAVLARGSSSAGGGGGGGSIPGPTERVWATAAAVTASVGVGADFVRVHDVRCMRDVVDAADAIYRGAGVPALQAPSGSAHASL